MATSLDPTVKSLEVFDDLSQWIVIPNVPAFIPHTRTRKDGTVIEVDEARLHRIAAEMNRLEKEDGVVAKLQIGHTKDELPETDQPPLVGYARNFHVGRWGPEKKLGLLVTHYYRKADWEEAKKYPFRSPEWYPGRDTITAIAVLERDPELDMGMLIFRRDDEHYYYSRNYGESMSEVHTKVEHHVEDDSAPTEKHHEEKHEDYSKHFSEHYAKHGTLPNPLHHPEMYCQHCGRVDHAAGPGVASSTDVAIPDAGKKKNEVHRMEREEKAIEDRKRDETIARLEKELEAERYHRRRAHCEQQVTQLQAEGYIVKDRAKLVEKLSKLDDAARDDALGDIRENYTRAPLEKPFIRPEGEVASATTREQHDAAVSLASRRGITYDAAIAEVKSKK